MAKPKLLIVEDDEGLCSQYRWAFPACDVLFAHTRQQALAVVKRDSPPVAIIDLGLPPDPDGVSEGFADHRGRAADRAGDQDDRRHRQRRPQATR